MTASDREPEVTSDDARRFRAQLANELVDAIEANDAQIEDLRQRIAGLEEANRRARNALRNLQT